MNISISDAYGPLIAGIMVYPENIALSDPIKNTRLNFDQKVAQSQYDTLLQVLKDNNIEIYNLDLVPSPSQVFTRDIGYVFDKTLFISNMSESTRQPEINPLLEFANSHGFDTYQMKNSFEGGDIFLHGNNIIVGVGGRTSEEAGSEIYQVLAASGRDYNLVPVRFDLSKIHIDCTFNILDKDTCILSGSVMEPEKIKKIFTNVIEISPGELTGLGPNIINLGNNKILCANEYLNTKLNHCGYQSTYIEFGEIIKVGGSLGCCLLPLVRSE